VALAVGVVLGLVAGILGASVIRDSPALPREEKLVGTVTGFTADRDAFAFAVDDGRRTSFALSGPAAESIREGAHVTLTVVQGDGYQVVVDAQPTG